ncbi:MAG TPA: energy transducer TonB [Candidatus Polarisedimenticolia bacterium]|jgi:protein TonB|nr:energy transducer TonB [Candidatus Polarisedimenticolia bacterium]
MTRKVVLVAFAVALLFHVGVLGFGGLVLFNPKPKATVREDVDLVGDEQAKKDDKKEEPKPEQKAEEKADEAEQVQQEAPVAPDLRDLQQLEAPSAPALAAMNLSDLEAALGGGEGSGGGDFGGAGGGSLASGGRIGVTGIGGGDGGTLDDILSAAELDGRPRPVFQATPQYPAELRKQRVEGTVNVVFFVDKDGRVSNPQVETSSNPAFERPALEAVRQWRFEAGTRKGEKVAFKMRVPISFHVSS